MDLQFVSTEELVNELLTRYDAGVFVAGKDVGGVWTTFNEWRAVRSPVFAPFSIIGMLEVFKHDLIRRVAQAMEEIKDDEPGKEED